jgi:hypothetical protein
VSLLGGLEMKKVIFSQVAADEILTITVPLTQADANKSVRVTVEIMENTAEPAAGGLTRERWLRFLEATAGKWQGELDRPPQGDYENRDQWP